METLDEILSAFEEALELERELGTRTVELEAATPVVVGSPRTASPHLVNGSPGAASPTRKAAQARPVDGGSPGAASPTRKAAQDRLIGGGSPGAASPTREAAQARPVDGGSPTVDFAFIAPRRPEGAAAALLAKMVAAMGYTLEQVRVVPAAEAVASPPPARVYVVLGGSDAFRTFAPGQRAALGLWTEVAGVPTIVTYSPARILSYFGDDAAGLAKAKRQIWSDLKSALARLGKTPPARA